ncbi:MAG: hypothetical protein E6Q78_05105 [Rhodoferax sp.]|nr:MAG: hypothetical protein E6Q78_05105 [Rhodoferax sp.]
MKEHPILFSAPMVRAILAGTKTQTRRVVKPTPEWIGKSGVLSFNGRVGLPHAICPYGQPGDRLWVREAWNGYGPFKDGMHYYYRATDQNPDSTKWKPSIHMPRAASRITLEITGVRVERLQDISEADAKAEGYKEFPGSVNQMDPVTWYQALWEQINGPGAWDANPWVWVVKFKRLEGGGA